MGRSVEMKGDSGGDPTMQQTSSFNLVEECPGSVPLETRPSEHQRFYKARVGPDAEQQDRTA